MYRDTVYLEDKCSIYKGATHLHTTRSDGAASPADAVRFYHQKGYHFLIWSDHDQYICDSSYDTGDFITIGGCERGHLNPYPENDNPGFHLGCIEDPTVTPLKRRYHNEEIVPHPERWEEFSTLTECIGDLEERGNLVVLNHPEWCMTPFDWVLQNNYFAIEIYNHATEWSTASSYGTAYWDHALQNGKRMFAIASDDVHAYHSDYATCDYGGGFIVVNAAKLDTMSIVSSLKAGRYFSSTGPTIKQLYVKNDHLHVLCSECKLIVFKSWPQRSEICMDRQHNEPVTTAVQKLGQYMQYIRVECIDFAGNVAWSNPVFLGDLR